ncbi:MULTISPECIES: FecR domain-containing protein [Dickeya]|uniref:Fe2+-dicitrate sensor, membrane component, anti-FecI sigma factor n=1 Tax=Dickeya aquatica TaxID=1401087 RepID=A0A375A6T4_9GAMM|nr:MULTISPECIES: FecR domain-containing protein [Dickeya]SLM61798.1 Fe2+-dicitrate sensor, membrane component, anti-FecI sigma factor [Dickeya aquatica]
MSTAINTTDRPDYAVLQQAAQWYARLLDTPPDSEQLARWQLWLSQSEAHRQAWHYVETVSQRFQPLRGDVTPLAAQTLLTPAPALSRRQTLRLGAALAGGSLLSWLAWQSPSLREPVLAMGADYRSQTGEIRALTLNDGSHLWLDTASALDVRYSATQRQLHLLAGTVFVEAAFDKQRPLIMTTREGTIHTRTPEENASASRFSARQLAGHTQLNVYAGQVSVAPSQRDEAQRIRAGIQWQFDAAGNGTTSPLLSEDADWRLGLLNASDTPLAQVITRLARYRRGYLACSPDIAALRVVGTFPLTDTDKALAMLGRALPIRIRRRANWWVTVEPA